MKKSIRIILIIVVIILLSIISLFSIYFLSKNNKKGTNKNEKIFYQIKYLDFKLIETIDLCLLNELNSNNEKILENITYIYENWNNEILDLSLNENINKQNINTFSENMNRTMIIISNSKSTEIAQNLINAYGELIKIYEQVQYNENYKNAMIIKYNLRNALIMTKSGKWIEAEDYIKKASEIITEIFNLDTEENSYNVNIAYISIKELENVVEMQNYNLFLIKYEIAIENIDKL